MNCILHLPLELVSLIFTHLSPRSLINLGVSCKVYSVLLTQEYDILWYSLLNDRLRKPLKYIYNLHTYNSLNHTLHPNWFKAYIHLIHNITNINDSSFSQAIQKGYLEIFRILLHYPTIDIKTKHINVYGHPYTNVKTKVSTLGLASTSGHTDILDELLHDSRFDPCDENNYVLIRTCISGQVESLRVLLSDPRIDPSYNNNEAIIEASRYGKSTIVEELLKDQRVNPVDQNNTAIFSCHPRHPQTVEILLSDLRVIKGLCGDIIDKLDEHKKITNPQTFKLYASMILATIFYINPNGLNDKLGGKLLFQALTNYIKLYT